MAEFVFNLSENTLTDRLNLVRAQSQNQTLTPILQTLIETANLRGNERHDLLDQVLNLQSDQQSECHTLIQRLYERLDRARFPLYNKNSWTVYYSADVNHQIAVYDDYSQRRNMLMNYALRTNQQLRAPLGPRPVQPVRIPYEYTEDKIILPLCPGSNTFLRDNPLEFDQDRANL